MQSLSLWKKYKNVVLKVAEQFAVVQQHTQAIRYLDVPENVKVTEIVPHTSLAPRSTNAEIHVSTCVANMLIAK